MSGDTSPTSESPLEQVLKSWFMVLHESVSFFEREDYERLQSLTEPAKAELAAMREAVTAAVGMKWAIEHLETAPLAASTRWQTASEQFEAALAKLNTQGDTNG